MMSLKEEMSAKHCRQLSSGGSLRCPGAVTYFCRHPGGSHTRTHTRTAAPRSLRNTLLTLSHAAFRLAGAG